MLQPLIDKLVQKTPSGVSSRVRGLSDKKLAWLFVGPTILLLLAINIFPLIWTIYLSFTNYRVNRPNRDVKWVDLRNYERILSDSDIWQTMQATAHFFDHRSSVVIGFTRLLINKNSRVMIC